jgi:addiction module RelE/StbE family toxin
MLKNRKVVWAKTAIRDLDKIIGFIHQTRPATAKKVLLAIKRKAKTLKIHAKKGRLLPELSHIPEISFREIVIAPWRLVYRIKDNIEVLALLDSRRDLDEIIFERLMR